MVIVRFILLVAFVDSTFLASEPELNVDSDAGLNSLQLIKKHGYPVERHQNVETKDGYLLEIHRIPYGTKNVKRKYKRPVLIMHGIMGSSADWVNGGPGKSIAYELADLGYDVWLGNARGNKWSRSHKTLSPDLDAKVFWDFSWHEIGFYDLPAIIDHILAVTDAINLYYIGHSQGTTIFFVLMSERPEYNRRVRLMSALAPIAYVDHLLCPPCRLDTLLLITLEWFFDYMEWYEFVPHNQIILKLGRQFCTGLSSVSGICSNMMFSFAGFDPEQFNESLLPVILTNLPSSSSWKQFSHYGQLIKYGKFSQYDFLSRRKNMAKYGQSIPPDYNISNIIAPIALHYGQNDWLASVTDVERLRDLLPNLVLDNKIGYKNFNHIDFLWAKDIFTLLYNDVIATMEKY